MAGSHLFVNKKNLKAEGCDLYTQIRFNSGLTAMLIFLAIAMEFPEGWSEGPKPNILLAVKGRGKSGCNNTILAHERHTVCCGL